MSLLQRLKKCSVPICVVLLIIVVQFGFVLQKEGYHMDELLSFELANAEYNPWIVPTQPVGRLAKFMQEEIDGDNLAETLGNIKDTVIDVLKNRGNSKLLTFEADVYEEPVWITGEQFKDYITTGKKDRFNYLSVYFNVKDDNHPPVHFMLLHTISSLFAGKAVPLMGCIINIGSLAGCAVLLMKLGKILDEKGITKNGTGSRFGVTAAVLYGCSQAAAATTLLIRMYGVLTFFCVALCYLHVRKWLEKEFDRRNGLLITVTVLGFLTQYFFLFYCLIFAAATAVCLLVYKRRKELLLYIRTMLLAAVIGVGVYPFSIGDVFSSSRGIEALDKLDSGLGVFLSSIVRFGEIVLDRCFGNVWLGLVLTVLSLIVGVCLYVRKKECRPLLVFFYVPVVGYFLLAAKLSPMLVDRYQMAVFPFVIAWFSLLVCMAAGKIRSRQKGLSGKMVLGAILTAYCIFHISTYDGSYLYRGYDEQIQIAKEYRHIPCISLYEGYWFYDNLQEFAEYERTLLVKPQELLERKNASDVEALEEVVFVIEQLVEEEVVLEILEQYDLQIHKVLLENGACGDRIYLCGKAE